MPLTFLAPAGAFDPAAVTAVYADGGVLNRNPSEVGGTWAFCLVNAIGGRLFGQAGHIAAAEVAPLPWVSNNLTEVVALLLALENLPDGWAGAAFSDSKNAIRAHMAAADLDPRKPGYLPDELWGRMVAARQRLGAIRWTLLGGHPTKHELAAGYRARDNKPVSPHNVWADSACQAAGATYLASLATK